jgi:hypothetical protein
MSLSQAAAGRARRVDSCVFFPNNVRQRPKTEATPHPPAGPYGWKRGLEDQIWSTEGPRGVSARAVLITLIRHADAHGRTWMSVSNIAAKAGIGSLRTVRNALETLAREGWLQVTSQTWASLTAEQTAAGRQTPRRADSGQAPNLYVVLGSPVVEAPRPGLVRIITPPSSTPWQNPSTQPWQNQPTGPWQNRSGPPLAKVHYDLDPEGSLSMNVGGEGKAPPEKSTHTFLKNRDGENQWRDAWALLVAAHAAKTETRFDLVPSKPDLRAEQQQAMAECLIHGANQVRKKLEQAGIGRDMADVQRELAEHVMRHYFKHDSEHLKRVKWALRDLSREMDARLIDAMQSLLREIRERDQPSPRPVPQDKPAPLAKAKPVESPVVPLVNNALEAQRIIEMLARQQAGVVPDKPHSAAHMSRRVQCSGAS